MIKILADWITYEILAIAPQTHLAEAVNFFIYDIIKIFLLLAVIVFAVSVIRTFLPPEKVRKVLSGKRKFTGNIMAGLLGIITPFCTCSAIPLFLGFIEAGVPLGATFSFLVASPMINEVALVLLLGTFGWKIALTYILSGLAIAVLAGMIIGRMNVEKLLEDLARGKGEGNKNNSGVMLWKDRIVYASNYTKKIIEKVGLYIILGVGLGAWMHGYVPAGFLANYLSAGNWYAVPLAVLAGIPLYSNAAGVVPLVGVLAEKGVAMGTSLAFMMAVIGLSLPEFMILKKVMKPKLIFIFAGIVGVGIIFTGYLFNFIL